jgi:hypothetical protein
VSTPPAGPRCPRCRRPLAAWRLEHCVYCGEAFPPGLKDGFQEPEALKWIERPPLPADVSKKLELMKVVPIQGRKKTRPMLAVAGLVSIPVFGAIFYLTFSLLRKLSPTAGLLVLAGGVGVLGYLVWIFARAARK